MRIFLVGFLHYGRYEPRPRPLGNHTLQAAGSFLHRASQPSFNDGYSFVFNVQGGCTVSRWRNSNAVPLRNSLSTTTTIAQPASTTAAVKYVHSFSCARDCLAAEWDFHWLGEERYCFAAVSSSERTVRPVDE